MAKEEQNICLVTTTYALFLYFLIKGFNEKDIFIFTWAVSDSVSKKLNAIKLPRVAFVDGAKMAPLNSIKGIAKNITGYCKYFYGYLKLRILLFFKTRNKEVAVYGHAQSPFSYMFYEFENSNIIEDGLMNYSREIVETHKINPIVDKILHICGIYFLNSSEALGSHKYIKHVYLTNELNHHLVKDKVVTFDIEDKWANLPKEDKDKILNVFGLEPSIINNFTNNSVLILTQPYTEHLLLSHEEEIQIYKNMINKYNDKKIYIKPHPHDRKDYSKIFPDLNIFEKSFPIELLELIGFKPQIITTVISTAVLNFKHSKIDIYDGDLNSDYLNKSRDDLRKLVSQRNY